MNVCTVDGCGRKRYGRGLCSRCYQRAARAGSLPEWSKPIRETVGRLMERVHKTDTCWLWTGGTNGRGYGVMGTERPRRTSYVHRLSYEHFCGPIPDGAEVAHSCDVRNCVNPDHLSLMSHRENEADKANKGRAPRGEGQWRAVLTEPGVRAIRSRVAGGESRRAIAEEFGVSVSNIDMIVTRKRWRHVE